MTLTDAADMFLSAIRGEVASATYRQYAFALSRLEPLANRPVASITTTDLRFVRGGLTDHYAPASVNMFTRVWKVLFNFCVDEGVLAFSPAARLRALKEPPRLKAACLEDVQRMVAEAHRRRHLRDEAIMLVLLSTGCRVGALCRIRLVDIDYVRQTASLLEKGNQWHTVNLIEPTYRAIMAYIDYERPGDVTNPLLFLSYKNPNNGLTSNSILYMLRRYADELGVVTPVNPHAFRHCFTVEMLKNGAPLDTVSKLLGHSTVTVTERFYAKWDTDTLAAAHARFNPVVNMNSS